MRRVLAVGAIAVLAAVGASGPVAVAVAGPHVPGPGDRVCAQAGTVGGPVGPRVCVPYPLLS